ncbi:effector-associated constant component EACC1 [Pseudofrankia asymbiotica]|uniref:Uncharacterized protein n=1 Tax=Pseudofrankia asymbiotica TaxID=1834516 RepID=A0A1V2I900_9ACTN|nr:hypothetical protein [Pseudofrankia asymbiotica]ONH28664.1 hypothetical protein BL253_18970 [Pseudofrankia asymbiotica]
MDVEIVADAASSGEELRSLRTWLLNEPEFQGRVALREESPRPGEMGVDTASMVVGLASGGGMALATASVRTLGSVVISWLKVRRSPVDLTFRRSDGAQVTISASEAKALPVGHVTDVLDDLATQLGPVAATTGGPAETGRRGAGRRDNDRPLTADG